MADDHSLSPEQVADWLRKHPDFLARHPELLRDMELPHETGATSLMERQVSQLRQDNAELMQRLRELAGIAGENERLMQRLHDLTLELSATTAPDRLVGILEASLLRDFRADRVMLLLDHPADGIQELDSVTPLPSGTRPDWVNRILSDGQPRCGRLTREKMDWVFGQDQAPQVASAALIPLERPGLLAIGSSSEERFYPDMGTLFLKLLGTTVNDRLARLESRQRRSA